MSAAAVPPPGTSSSADITLCLNVQCMMSVPLSQTHSLTLERQMHVGSIRDMYFVCTLSQSICCRCTPLCLMVCRFLPAGEVSRA